MTVKVTVRGEAHLLPQCTLSQCNKKLQAKIFIKIYYIFKRLGLSLKVLRFGLLPGVVMLTTGPQDLVASGMRKSSQHQLMLCNLAT